MEPREVVERQMALEGEGNLDGALELYSPQVELVAVDGTAVRGRDQVEAFLRRETAGFPDWRLSGEIVAAEGPTVVQRWTWRGTHTEPLTASAADAPKEPLTVSAGATLPPTGRQVVIEGVSLTRVEDGLITWTRRFYDNLGVAQQLGLVAR